MGTSLNSSLEALFEKMEGFVRTKTVVGDPIHFDNVIVIPLIEVSVGVGAGAHSGGEEKKGSESGGGGLGAKITPSSVVVITNGTVQLVNVKSQDSVNKLIDMVPGFVSKLGSLFSKDKKEEAKKEEAADKDLADAISEALAE